MSRTRMIKPAFFKHAELYEAEIATGMPLRVAFAGLFTVADREGRFRWKIDLKPDVLPYDPIDFMAVLDALERFGFVHSYVVDSRRFGWIPRFKQHQTFHHTERGSTLPAPPADWIAADNSPSPHGEPDVKSPISHGESPGSSPADTVTVTGTVADTGTELDAAAGRAAVPAVVPSAVRLEKRDVPGEPELTALYLTIWANGAVAERWGESPHPYMPASAVSLADELRAVGVEWQTARLSMYRQCRESKQATKPRGINYFRAGIEEDWGAEIARRALASSGEVPPAPDETVRTLNSIVVERGRRGKTASPAAGHAALLVQQIKALAVESRQPGQAAHRYIPRAKVAALGADVLRAYDASGGADRFLGVTGEQISFLVRDFSNALEAARATA